MADAHFLGKPLPYGSGTKAFWAKRPIGQAVVFVHGFRGQSLATWNNFQTLLLAENDPRAIGSDLVFYGYDGVKTTASNSATLLRNFLRTLIDTPTAVINPTLLASERRPASFKYKRVLVVAHSLGAVVARRAALDGHLAQETWVRTVRLAFFAPAHMGANVIELISEAFLGIPWVGGAIGPFIRWRATVLQDLEPGSNMLNLLQQDAARALGTGPAPHLLAKVWSAEWDNVVQTVRFPVDPVPAADSVILGRGHVNVCKPASRNAQALREVLKLL